MNILQRKNYCCIEKKKEKLKKVDDIFGLQRLK